MFARPVHSMLDQPSRLMAQTRAEDEQLLRLMSLEPALTLWEKGRDNNAWSVLTSTS